MTWMTWQPIDTHTLKDGRPVYIVAQLHWNDPPTTMFGYWNQRHYGWYRFGAPQPTQVFPTHWMPLPPCGELRGHGHVCKSDAKVEK